MAVLDWGIGGLGFFRLLRLRRPGLSIAYFSDSGEVPYGRLSNEQLSYRLLQIIEFLSRRGVTHLVVACNAMSTVLPVQGEVGDKLPVRITGVIEPTIEALRSAPYKRYGIVGGRRTIFSGAYRQQLQQPGKIIRQRIGQSLSRLIEDGRADSPAFSLVLDRIVKPLRKSDALILGCTHYSAALDQFIKLMPGTAFIDPAELTLEWIERNWFLPASMGKKDVFFTTGPVLLMKKAAQKAFGIKIGMVHKLDLDLDKYT